MIPFGTKHRGKRLQQCRDKPWIEWTTTKPFLIKKVCVRVSSVVLSDKFVSSIPSTLQQSSISLPTHDITPLTGTSGKLLSATEYEDDLNLVQEDDEYEKNSFIDDGDTEEAREGEENSESAEAKQESTQPRDVDGAQSGPESHVQTTPFTGTASLGSAYRLGKYRNSSSPSMPFSSINSSNHRENKYSYMSCC